MTCNNVILAQPEANTNVSYTIPEGDSARLNFTPDDISALQVGNNGELIISFDDGGQLTITNFEDLVDNGNLIHMADGTLIDPSILTASPQAPEVFTDLAAASGADADPIIINQPTANTTQEISMEQGQKYICDFDPANAATVELKDGKMVLTFADGSQVIINNYETAMAGQLPPELTVADGTAVETETLLTEVTEVAEPIEEVLELAQAEVTEPIAETLEIAQESVAEQVANVEPAAGEEDLAEALANIETAAGEEGGETGNSGYGFNSSAVDVPLNSIDAIGPLDPTKLAYQAPEVQPENPFILSTPAVDDQPTITFAEEIVDETNLDNGNLVVTGSIDATYGNDTPGAITTTGQTTVVCPSGSDTITSTGVDVVITSTDGGYVGTANGETVFTFEIDPVTGDYTFTQLKAIDHPDSSDPNDPLCINFGIKATDADGDSSFSNVRVTILDDAPVTGDDFNTIDETDLDAPIVINDQVSVDFGNDGQGLLQPSGSFTATGPSVGNQLTSNGVAVVVTATTNGYVGVAGGETIFTLEINSETGEYTFTLNENLDHAGINQENDIITLNFGTIISDFDGDTDPGQITIDIVDGEPVANDDCQMLDDDGNAEGNVVTGENGGNGAADSSSEGMTVTSISFGNTTVEVPATGTTTIEGDHGVLTISSDGSYSYELNEGEGNTTITTTSFDPSNTDVAGTQSSISNDGITIRSNSGQDLAWFSDPNVGSGVGITGGAAGSPKVYGDGEELEVLFDNAVSTATVSIGDMGSNNIGQEFSYEVHLADGTVIQETVTIDASSVNNGIFTFDVSGYDSDITQIDLVGGPSYVLNRVTGTTVEHHEIQDEFDYTITDNDGDTSTATLKLIGTPSDDVNPINISGEGETDDTNLANGPDVENGVINVNYQGDGPGTTTGNGDFNASGNLTGGVLSYNGIPVNVTFDEATNTYTGSVSGSEDLFTMVIHSDGTYTFTQYEALDHSNTNANNERLFLEFGVTATDSDGDTGQGTVTITVRDDAPEAHDDTVNISDNDTTAEGNVLSNDNAGQDASEPFDTGAAEVTNPGTYTGQYGTLVLNSDGSYKYTRNGQEGGTDTFEYTMRDRDGDTDTATLTINVADDLSPVDISGEGETDDTNLADGPDVENGVINVDYQGDGPGTTTGNGNFNASGNMTNNTLTSNGHEIQVGFNSATNTYVGSINGFHTVQIVFTMEIHDNGTYTFTQVEPLDHSNTNAANERLFLEFGVTATDSDGDTGQGTVTITVRDDAPEAHDDTASTGSSSSSETHCFDPTESDVTGTQNSITQDGITLTASNGGDLAWFSDPNLGSGVGIAGGTANTNKVYGDGESLNLSFTHAADSVTIELGDMGANNIGNVFAYTVHLADGSSIEETITIDGAQVSNGIFAFDVSGYNSEISSIDLVGGPSFVLHGVKAENTVFESTNAEGNVLANDDLSVDDTTLVTSIKVDGQDYAVTNAGVTINTQNGILTIAANGDYTYEATNNEDSTNIFTYTITDADGDTSTADLTISSTGISHEIEAKNDHFSVVDVSAGTWDAEKGDTVIENPYNDMGGWDPTVHDRTYTLSDGVTVHEDTNNFYEGFWFNLPVLQNDTAGVTITSAKILSLGNENQEIKVADDGKSILFRAGPDQDPSSFEYDITKLEYTVVDQHGQEDTAVVTVSSWDATSPLVLDLDGDGIELLPMVNGVQFDMDNDGQVEQTGWVGADDALLALDKNNDGVINDQSELFGNSSSSSDGFDNLANYDSNADGIIDQNDEVYEDLTVWQDANSDGVSDEGEMLSLMDVGVVSIFLNADMPDDLIIEGNWISHTSTFTTTDGQEHAIVDAWFETRELSDTELGAIEEASDTLLALNEIGDDVLDISQMLETSDDVTEAIQDFVHNTDAGDASTFSNDNGGSDVQDAGLSIATVELDDLPQGSGDQAVI